MHKVISLLFLFLICGSVKGQGAFSQANSLLTAKKYAAAEALLEKEVAKAPNDLQLKELYGDALGFQKKWNKAIDVYKDLAHNNVQNANYFYKYGGALGMKALSVNKLKALGMIGDNRNAFLKAAQLDPNHIDVRWALVEFYMQLPGIVGGSEKKAHKYANELLKLSPVDGYLAKGYIAEYTEDFKAAEEAYKKAIQTGGSEHTYEKLTTLYEVHNKPFKAIETAKSCLEVHKNNRFHYQIGKIAAAYNINVELGINCLKTYIEKYTVKDGVPVDWAYYRLAQIYRKQGDKAIAEQYISKALVDRPDFKEALQEKSLIEQMACC
jgi:tetratricopeptide (TPR) repeat protein